MPRPPASSMNAVTMLAACGILVDARDERTVDLQQVDRDLAQTGQRGVARAEVVDRDAEAAAVKLPQDLLRAIGVDHGRGLRDLDDDARRIHAALA